MSEWQEFAKDTYFWIKLYKVLRKEAEVEHSNKYVHSHHKSIDLVTTHVKYDLGEINLDIVVENTYEKEGQVCSLLFYTPSFNMCFKCLVHGVFADEDSQDHYITVGGEKVIALTTMIDHTFDVKSTDDEVDHVLTLLKLLI